MRRWKGRTDRKGNCMEHQYVKEILSHYNIPDSQAVLLRHNENMTFRIGTEYLLQIHEPAEGFRTEHIYEGTERMAVYRIELRFLRHLKEQGMTIREPVENCAGELITKLDSGIAATVSRWIEGEPLDKLELNAERCHRIGELTAALHKCAKGFQGFPMITYDGQQCARIKEKVRSLEDCGLSPVYFGTMQRACDAVGTALEKVRSEFLTVHADLSPSNILETKDGLAAIDFSLFGVGHPMLDLANLFGNINGLSSRQNIAEGYRKAGGIIDYRALDACFVLSILGGIAIHFERWSRQDWFEGRLKRWCEESFEPLCAGERLFTDDFYVIHAGNRS